LIHFYKRQRKGNEQFSIKVEVLIQILLG